MKRNGFTLIEIVVTLMVVSVMFLAIAGFVQFGAKGYSDTVDRQQLQNQARFALEKMTREFRHAVPNSFELDGSANECIAFYPIKYSGFYHFLETSDEIEFVVGNEGATYPLTFATNDYLVINPSRIDDLEIGTAQRIALSGETIPAATPFLTVSSAVASHSIANRHFIYNTEQRIRYCISGTRLEKTIGSATPVPVARLIDPNNSGFSFEQSTLQRGGLVHIDLTLELGEEVSEYKHDVQVMNVQ